MKMQVQCFKWKPYAGWAEDTAVSDCLNIWWCSTWSPILTIQMYPFLSGIHHALLFRPTFLSHFISFSLPCDDCCRGLILFHLKPEQLRRPRGAEAARLLWVPHHLPDHSFSVLVWVLERRLVAILGLAYFWSRGPEEENVSLTYLITLKLLNSTSRRGLCPQQAIARVGQSSTLWSCGWNQLDNTHLLSRMLWDMFCSD